MATTASEFFRIYLKLVVLLLYFIPSINRVEAAAASIEDNFELCNGDLEKKFIPENAKCPHSGLFPVKGSCTAFVACFSLDIGLTKSIRVLECSAGMAFDIAYLQCKVTQKLDNNCLQQKCYPAETLLENKSVPSSSSSSSKKVSGKINTNSKLDDDDDDVDEIVLDIQQHPITNNASCDDDEDAEIQNNRKNNNSCLIITSSSAIAIVEQGSLKFVGGLLHLFVLKFLHTI